MKVNTISISKGMTVNLGNYNTHRVEIGMTATFDEGDDIADGMSKLTAMVNGKLADEVLTTIQNAPPVAKLKKQILMEKQDA